MTKHRWIALATAALSSSAAMAAPAVFDNASPEPSTWLTVLCGLFLLTTMQRRR